MAEPLSQTVAEMRIVLTGAGGFVGRALVAKLVRDHHVAGIDSMPLACDGTQAIIGDLCDRLVLQAASDISLRLPGIIARSKGSSGMKSAFMSDVFHVLNAGEATELPVSAEATLWLMSLQQLVSNLGHALQITASGSYTLPTIRTSMHERAGAVAQTTGRDPALATPASEPAIEERFGCQPPLSTPAALSLGFADDGSLGELVASALRTLA